jgi:SecD/SecF fusion protein
VRFQWKYSVGVLVALAHDIVITIGIYALTGREVSTCDGRGGPDRARIFDLRHDHRLRPDPGERPAHAPRIVPRDRQHLDVGGPPRSLATTFITLLPVGCLYFFGGDTLKDFAFALLVGIGSGAYSSIFLAARSLAALKEREPEFARRRDDLGALAGSRPSAGRSRPRPRRSRRRRETSSRRRRRGRRTRPAPVAAPAGAGLVQARAPSATTRLTPHGRAR